MITRKLLHPVIAALVLWVPLVCASCTPSSEPGDGAVRATGPSEAAPADGEASAAESRRPPRLILLVSIDTLRPDHLGFYGHERFTSPVLDELAREGTVFDDVTASASWTLPSHTSMLTGLFPREHGVVDFRTALPPEIPTVAGFLSRAGWDTAAVVNVAWLKRENYRVTRDFEHYAWAPATVDRRTANTWVTDQVIDWVNERGEKPLFVMAHYYDVHSDYVAAPAYEKLFLTPYDGPMDGTGKQLKLQALPEAYIESCARDFDPDRCSFSDLLVVNADTHKRELGPDDIRHLEELYDSQIRQLDAELARLFADLRREGVFDDTLVLVTSDHGEEFGEHGSLEHFYTPYQEVVRVPLLMHGPGVPGGQRIQAPVGLVDLAPTILAAAGVEAPASLEGLDLLSLVRGGDDGAFRERPLWVEAPGGAAQNVAVGDYFPVFYAVRRGHYKLVLDQLSGRHALYDLSTDPHEQTDIQEREPKLSAELLSMLEERHAEPAEGKAGSAVELAPEELERLRALGYVP